MRKPGVVNARGLDEAADRMASAGPPTISSCGCREREIEPGLSRKKRVGTLTRLSSSSPTRHGRERRPRDVTSEFIRVFEKVSGIRGAPLSARRTVVGKPRSRKPFVIIVGLLAILGLLAVFRVIELRPRAASTVHAVFNYVEAAIWGVAGLCTIWRLRGKGNGSTLRVLSCVAAVAFLAFGLSDLVEVRTGTWYAPWWLFAWKAACVLTLLACYGSYKGRLRIRKKGL